MDDQTPCCSKTVQMLLENSNDENDEDADDDDFDYEPESEDVSFLTTNCKLLMDADCSAFYM